VALLKSALTLPRPLTYHKGMALLATACQCAGGNVFSALAEPPVISAEDKQA